MKIGITGATGQLGRLVVEKLKAKGYRAEVVALVRSKEKAAALGVEAREADYSRPETLETAFQGLDAVLLVSSNELGQRFAQHSNVIEAAKRAGVNWILYTSLLRADSTPLRVLADEHEATEKAIRASGLPYTILRNGWYTENYTGSIGGALAGGAFLGSAGAGLVSSAAREDYAEAAAVVLTTAGHQGKTYELAGDESYTLSGLAAEISRQAGREIPYRDLPEAEYASVLKGFGLPEAMANAYANFDTAAAAGALYDNGKVLSGLLGRPTTPLSTSVAAALDQAR